MGIKTSTLPPLLKRLGTLSVDKLERLLLETAVYANASDVHIEPQTEVIQVRFRVDGLLRQANELPNTAYAKLVAHFKLRAGLERSQHTVPQEGSYTVEIDGTRYALHLSTLPVADGEKIVIHFSDTTSHTRSLLELGFWGQALDTLNEAIVQPHGMVLCGGPDSTAVMYTLISQFDPRLFNIITIEDAIAYQLPGVNQTQLNHRAQVTSAAVLRALRRQDADIIMVGNSHDSETVCLAVETALAGRLVFSGIHAPDTAGAVANLSAMGIQPYLNASALRTVVDHRLARRLCTKCRIPFTPSPDNVTALRQLFGIKNNSQLAKLGKLEAAALSEGIGSDNKKLAVDNKTISRLYRANLRGCNACDHTGYKGQIGLCEVLPLTDDMRTVITSSAPPATIASHAADAGMVGIRLDGFVKALRGLTTFEEVLRLT